MDNAALKTFAQKSRTDLMAQTGARLKLVLSPDSLERREYPNAIRDLEKRIGDKGKDAVIEEIAYTWFNRFCALRFMDVNHYNQVGIVSPAEGQVQPEILGEAKMGIIDDAVVPPQSLQKITDLLSGRLQSRDAQGEAYRLLLVSYCNHLHKAMPFLFEHITDYTELLMPTGLLAVNSVLAECRKVLTVESCRDVEVIGWLYQYYISERKDEVFKNFKKGKKAGPREIPAATQLFTPHWIVRYLVENSLGRLWMLNHPRSRLVDKMEYYIKSDQEEQDFLRISKPEEIKVCDPACGSGHMLTYAFDLLYAMYEEQGYSPSSIPSLILKHNLYGIEIDKRAGELAAFALTMKARQKSHKFFSNPVEPNVCVLENIHFDQEELKGYMDHIGRDLFTSPLQATLKQFEEADNFGSLIQPEITDVQGLITILESKNISEQLFLSETHQKVLQALCQVDYLSPRYHVVVANPPYMGGSNMNSKLSSYLKDNYPDVKSDLFSAFIVRNTELAVKQGQLGFMSPYVWMFISSYEKLRALLINQKTITSLIQLEYSGFDGATVPICTFTFENRHKPNYKGAYIRLSDFRGAVNQAPKTLEAINNPDCGWFYRVSADEFQKIPGSPIAYWVSERFLDIFPTHEKLESIAKPRQGATTSDNNRFLRQWFEVNGQSIGYGIESLEFASRSKYKWFPYNKGGDFRRWYGNHEFVINYENGGKELKEFHDILNITKPGGRLKNQNYYFLPSVSWSKISSGTFAMRYYPSGFIFDVAGSAVFFDTEYLSYFYLGLLNTVFVKYVLKAISPTLNFEAEHLCNLPILSVEDYGPVTISLSKKLITFSKIDWDSYETSWDFSSLPLLDTEYRQDTLADTYQILRALWNEMALEMQRLEEENNRIFIEAYGLEDELTPEVPLKEITLTCNPYYRYGDSKSEAELEALLLADTMKEFISYAVGCMFGRYSIDKPGLILANQGETYEDYCRLVPDSSFPADRDNAIPILDGEWFTDDIVSRFRKFLRVTFGEDHYEENLRFIEGAIGKDLRQYFLKDFYNDHVKRYKKRPIYWMFSSPDGSFNVLIYMHRYRSDTASIVLTEYLREYRFKLASHVESLRRIEANPNASKSDRTKAMKEQDKLKKVQDVLETYERDVLYPLATQKIEIDLDDGVKVNYPKFYPALKKIPGLEAKE
ncbi:MAG: BREX-1 system adenine-specific DNA-methyltransferase PglX [Sphaerochaetaceae bacterium]